MWSDNKYDFQRDAAEGGLKLCLSESFCPEAPIERKLKNNFKELMCIDETHPGIGFFPLDVKKNTFSFAMCQKTKGTKKDIREHHNITGFVTNSSDDALDLCYTIANYINQKEGPLNLFFSENTNLDLINPKENSDETDMSEQSLLIQLCQKMITLKNNNIKLIIFTPDKDKYFYFCLLTYILIELKLPLFITADMSCTLTAPDIMIISDESHQENLSMLRNGIHYEELSIEEFQNSDNNDIIENSQKAKLKYSDEIDSLLNECKNYLSNNSISEDKLYAIIDKFYKENNNYYGIFRNCLKDLLSNFDCDASMSNRFITLTYIVFKDDTYTSSMEFSSAMTSPPYDFNGMCSFLKSKAKSARQYHQFLNAMRLILDKTCFKTPNEKLTFRDSLKNTITNFLK